MASSSDPQRRLSELTDALLSVTRYVDVLERLDRPADEFRAWRAAVAENLQANLELAQHENLTLVDVVGRIDEAIGLLDALPSSTGPFVQAVQLPASPVLYEGGLPPIIIVPPNPGDVGPELDELWRLLQEWLAEHPELRDELADYLIDLWQAIEAVKNTGGLTSENLRRLGAALAAIWRFLSFRGLVEGSLRDLLRRFALYLLRLARLLGLGGTGGGGATAGGSAGVVLVDLLITVVLLALWALMWIKIGSWFWNRPVGSSGESYIDFWGRQAFDVYRWLVGRTCDDLLELWIRADREVRAREADGSPATAVVAAAAHAWAIAMQLLKECPTLAIRNVIRTRVVHYDAIHSAFEKSVGH